MAVDDTPHPDIVLLNAFVDGELSPAERADIADRIRAEPDIARAHATLMRLKASIAASADATPPVTIVAARKTPRQVANLAVRGFLACAAILSVLFTATHFLAERGRAPFTARDAMVTLAALPADPVIPDLEMGGLTLVDVKIESVGGTRLLVASYRGPHGCLLDLRVSPLGSAVSAGAGSSRHSWKVGPLAYELLAHGMPGGRFAIIADAAERETRDGTDPGAVRGRLREARAAAPPCAG